MFYSLKSNRNAEQVLCSSHCRVKSFSHFRFSKPSGHKLNPWFYCKMNLTVVSKSKIWIKMNEYVNVSLFSWTNQANETIIFSPTVLECFICKCVETRRLWCSGQIRYCLTFCPCLIPDWSFVTMRKWLFSKARCSSISETIFLKTIRQKQ